VGQHQLGDIGLVLGQSSFDTINLGRTFVRCFVVVGRGCVIVVGRGCVIVVGRGCVIVVE
jgi:hypothetical protein